MIPMRGARRDYQLNEREDDSELFSLYCEAKKKKRKSVKEKQMIRYYEELRNDDI